MFRHFEPFSRGRIRSSADCAISHLAVFPHPWPAGIRPQPGGPRSVSRRLPKGLTFPAGSARGPGRGQAPPYAARMLLLVFVPPQPPVTPRLAVRSVTRHSGASSGHHAEGHALLAAPPRIAMAATCSKAAARARSLSPAAGGRWRSEWAAGRWQALGRRVGLKAALGLARGRHHH